MYNIYIFDANLIGFRDKQTKREKKVKICVVLEGILNLKYLLIDS